jgi:hypothetical protein
VRAGTINISIFLFALIHLAHYLYKKLDTIRFFTYFFCLFILFCFMPEYLHKTDACTDVVSTVLFDIVLLSLYAVLK